MATLADIDKALQQFALSSQPQTRTGQIHRFLPQILSLREQGFRFQDIARLLTEHGISVTGKQLSEAVRQVQRTRRYQGAMAKPKAGVATPTQTRQFLYDPKAPAKDLF